MFLSFSFVALFHNKCSAIKDFAGTTLTVSYYHFVRVHDSQKPKTGNKRCKTDKNAIVYHLRTYYTKTITTYSTTTVIRSANNIMIQETVTITTRRLKKDCNFGCPVQRVGPPVNKLKEWMTVNNTL